MIKSTLEPSLLERRPLTITQKGNEKRMSYLTFMVSESPKTMNDFLTKESKQWRLLKSLLSQLASFDYKIKSVLYNTPVLRKLSVNWDKLPFCLLDVWVPDLGSQQSKFLSALFWANLNYTLLSKQFISKLYISTLLVNKYSLLSSFLAIVNVISSE